jgi:soluble lytic murein transglycosylase-like protein
MNAPRRVAWLALTIALAACSTGAAPVAVAPTTAAPATAAATPSPTPAPTVAPTATPVPPPDWSAVPIPATDPAGLAAQLVTAEGFIRDPKVTGDQLAWAGHMEQLVLGTLSDYPDWTDQVISVLPADQKTAISGAIEAGKQLRTLHGPIPKNLPDWHIVAPAPIDELLADYHEGEAKYGVPWYYLASINLIETRMGRIRGDSSAGAQGPMQFIPQTWAAYGQGDINSPHDAILAAARYLKAAGAPGDMSRAIFAYNHSLGYVNAVIAYAEVMKADQAALRGYYGWQVYFPTPDGVILMPVGWKKS